MNVWPQMNPEYPYTYYDLTARRSMEQAMLRVAQREGKETHPAVSIARDNLKFIEERLNEYPS